MADVPIGSPPPAVQGSKLAAVPLLKFGQQECPLLCDEGIEALERLPGPVCPIAFVGDGRSGKSFLASKLSGSDDSFVQDDSAVAVTSGIDVLVMPSHPGHLVIFDCEGGNNAMSKSHSIVTVVGALLATALVFVTDGKASEAAIEALALMLQERALIKCDGTGTLQAQTLLFVVNQNRLRYDEGALETILSRRDDEEGAELRDLIDKAYPEGRRFFHTVPPDTKKGFAERWQALQEAVHGAAGPLKMGKLWMTGAQVVSMLRQVEKELRTRGKVSLPSLHRHVILDSWLKPTVGQVLASRMDKLVESNAEELLVKHKVGSVQGACNECKKEGCGWLDPDIEEFFCEDCWKTFSPKVLKCGFCNGFQPWPLGRVEQATKMWHCIDCLMQLGIDVE